MVEGAAARCPDLLNINTEKVKKTGLMARTPTPCPTCGAALADEQPHAELLLVGTETGDVKAAQRMVRGTCPVCGPRLGQRTHMGNHDTTTEARMKRRYPKAGWTALKARLEPADRKRFTAALHGQVWVTDEDRQRWDAAALDPGSPIR